MPEPLLSLDRNENLYGPAPKCFEVLKNISAEELSLYSRDYTRGVKSKLSERLSADLDIPESQILLSEGSEDMLKQAVHCYLGPGERILCPEQSWWYYRSVAAEVGGVTVTYRLRQERNRYSYDADEIIRLYRATSPRVILIASPNNPTGNSLAEEELDRLSQAMRAGVLILDEAYWGFAEHFSNRVSELVAKYPNLLILRTFSKFYALAGVRIAYAAAGTDLAKLSKFASRYLGYNRISEQLALAALDSPDYYREVRKRICTDRRRLYEFFDEFSDATCFRSDANFVLVNLPHETKEAAHQHLHRSGISVKTFADPEFTDCLRITLGTSDHTREVIRALGALETSRSLQNTIA